MTNFKDAPMTFFKQSMSVYFLSTDTCVDYSMFPVLKHESKQATCISI